MTCLPWASSQIPNRTQDSSQRKRIHFGLRAQEKINSIYSWKACAQYAQFIGIMSLTQIWGHIFWGGGGSCACLCERASWDLITQILKLSWISPHSCFWRTSKTLEFHNKALINTQRSELRETGLLHMSISRISDVENQKLWNEIRRAL